MFAPWTVQLKNLQDDIATEDDFESPASTAKAPPMLKEGSPVVPLATDTMLLLNVDSVTLKLVRAALLAYTAPPPPLASPGRADDEFVNNEHWKKWDFDIKTVTLNPLEPSTPAEGSNKPCLKLETWGEWSIAKAPPKTEDVPRELSVTDTAAQFVTLLRLNTTTEFVMEVLPKGTRPELIVPK
jgi:hypothetical protein